MSSQPSPTVTPSSSLTEPYWHNPVAHAVIAAITVRLALAGAGVVSRFTLPTGANYHSILRSGHPANILTMAVDACVRLDSFWYASVALHGYSYSDRHLSSIGYYPLYPLLIKCVSLATGDVYVAGALISTICLLGAAAVMVVWLRDRGLQNRALAAVAILLCFPFSFFFAAMFTESLYLLLALLSFVWWERQRWFLAGGATALAVLTRPTALALVAAFALPALRSRSRELGPWFPVVAGSAAFAGFLGYQFLAFGTPLAYVRTHAAPPNYATLSRVVSDLLDGRPGIPHWYMLLMFAIGLLFLAAVPLVYRRFGAPYAVYAGVSVALPLLSSLPGIERYAIVDFPVFAAVACTDRFRLLVVAVTLSFWFELFASALFVRGYGLF